MGKSKKKSKKWKKKFPTTKLERLPEVPLQIESTPTSPPKEPQESSSQEKFPSTSQMESQKESAPLQMQDCQESVSQFDSPESPISDCQESSQDDSRGSSPLKDQESSSLLESRESSPLKDYSDSSCQWGSRESTPTQDFSLESSTTIDFSRDSSPTKDYSLGSSPLESFSRDSSPTKDSRDPSPTKEFLLGPSPTEDFLRESSSTKDSQGPSSSKEFSQESLPTKDSQGPSSSKDVLRESLPTKDSQGPSPSKDVSQESSLTKDSRGPSPSKDVLRELSPTKDSRVLSLLEEFLRGSVARLAKKESRGLSPTKDSGGSSPIDDSRGSTPLRELQDLSSRDSSPVKDSLESSSQKESQESSQKESQESRESTPQRNLHTPPPGGDMHTLTKRTPKKKSPRRRTRESPRRRWQLEVKRRQDEMFRIIFHRREVILSHLDGFCRYLENFTEQMNLLDLEIRIYKMREMWLKFTKISKGLERQGFLSCRETADCDAVYEDAMDRADTFMNRVSYSPFLRLPVFNGEYEDWLSCNESFTEILHKNKLLRPVEKLYFLKNCLEDEAARTVMQVPYSDENYPKALELLKNRYNDHRVLVQTHIRRLLELPRIDSKSILDLRWFVDEAVKHVDALRQLKQPVDSWHVLIQYAITSKLDRESRLQWEKQIENNPQPKLQDLWAFLSAYVFTENIETLKCIICTAIHDLSYCPKFRAKKRKEKMEFLKQEKLCYNCLRANHKALECGATNCRKCGQSHHILLHANSKRKNLKPSSRKKKPAEESD